MNKRIRNKKSKQEKLSFCDKILKKRKCTREDIDWINDSQVIKEVNRIEKRLSVIESRSFKIGGTVTAYFDNPKAVEVMKERQIELDQIFKEIGEKCENK